MPEDYLVRHCAPTLAGLKTGSMFVCPMPCRDALLGSIRRLNAKLAPKGLRVIPLRFSEKTALIYLYRPKGLSRDLADEAAARLLEQNGYRPATCENCIAQLRRRLDAREEFPHEIGLFLGYPAEDVQGFIENKACGCKCVGCWKVYGDEAAAQKRFDQYRKCTRVYCHRWAQGASLDRLTVKSNFSAGS